MMETFSERISKIERLAIERAYKLYYGKELNYKAHLDDIRKKQAGEYWEEPVRNKIKVFTKWIEEENQKGFTYIETKEVNDRDDIYILRQVIKHFKNIGLKARGRYNIVGYFYITISW